MKQTLGPLGEIDFLTDPELRASLGHQISHTIREWYRGVDYMGFAGPGNGTNTVIVPGADQGYTWDVKLVSAQLAAAGSLSVYPGDTTGVAPVGVASSVVNGSGTTEFNPPNPAAGTSYTYTLPMATSINSLTFIYTASATVTTRFPTVSVTDPAGNIVYRVPVSNGVVANTFITAYGSIGGMSALSATFDSYFPLTPQVFPAGYKIVIAASGMPAGDTITNVFITFGTPLIGSSIVNECVCRWSANQLVLKDGRNLTLFSSVVILNWRIMVKQVPTEMQGKL